MKTLLAILSLILLAGTSWGQTTGILYNTGSCPKCKSGDCVTPNASGTYDPAPCVAQTKPETSKAAQPPARNDDHIIVGNVADFGTMTITLQSTAAVATLMHKVDNGVYTLTFKDPNNRWRCVVTSQMHTRPDNPLYDSVSAFTVTCYDTTDPMNVPNGKPSPDLKKK